MYPILLNDCPDYVLIQMANVTEDKALQFAIDTELEQRYEEIREELEEYQYYELDEEFMNY
jgi:hypothetical protein